MNEARSGGRSTAGASGAADKSGRMSSGRSGLRSARRDTPPEPAAGGREPLRPALLVGGAGFVGANLAHRLLSEGCPVLVFDNLSRPGVERNLQWLTETHGRLLRTEIGDVRDADALRRAVAPCAQVFHFAAQVAVTTSLADPISDFEINARGTLNLLEAVRAQDDPPPLVFTSTNKVYGALEDVALVREGARYRPADAELSARGISEARRVEFHSPYGCSKGAADQYVLDYARTFGLPAVVFRMSCIYGPRQFGTEDQGWVAHFLIRAIAGRPVTLYGDGMQVRDLLFIEDLVDALLLAQERVRELSGRAFNIGGGPTNAVSLLEVLELIEELHDEGCGVEFAEWRPADQRYYVSDTRSFEAATSWRPKVSVREGIERLYRWLLEARGLPTTPLAGKQAGDKGSQAARHELAAPRG